MVSFIDLPEEVIVYILAFKFDRVTLVRCTQVCKRLRATIRGSEMLLYLIELDTAGYMDNPSCQMSLAQRVDALRRLQTSLAAQEPSVVGMFTVDRVRPQCIQLCQGYLCYSRGYRDGQDVVTVVQLPSVLSDVTLERWVLPPFPFEILLLNFDPSQDLLVLCVKRLVESDGARPTYKEQLYVVSLKNGGHHPESTGEFMQLPDLKSPADRGRGELVIRGHMASVLFPWQYFAVLSWKSGYAYMVSKGVAAAALVDTNLVMTIKFEKEISHIRSYLIRHQRPGVNSLDCVHIRSLGLPVEFSSHHQGTLLVSCAVSACGPSGQQQMPSASPFSRSNTSSDIILIRFYTRQVRTLLPFRDLFFRVKALRPKDGVIDSPILSPWKRWCINNAFWYTHAPETFLPECWVNGDRAVVRHLRGGQRSKFKIMDMSSVRAKREGSSCEIPEKDDQMVSHLPLRALPITGGTMEFERLMLDDERMVVLRSNDEYPMNSGGPPPWGKIEVWNLVQ